MKRQEWISAVVALLILIFTSSVSMEQPLTPDLEQPNLIRLHVIANSDSTEDQALKYMVRDRLLLAFRETFQDVRTTEEARELIALHMEDLEEIASDEIEKQGYEYPVDASLGVSPFPTKVYGEKVYPAGDYEALKVVIGEGIGANWWCVMFPPLCFVDVSSGVNREPGKPVFMEDQTQYGKSKEPKNPAQPENPTQKADQADENELIPSATEENEVVYTLKVSQWWNRLREWVDELFEA